MSLKKRLKIIFTISNKELIDYVRDWRTLLAVVLVPLLMFPTIFFVLPIVMQSELDERQSLNLEVLIETNQNSSEFEFLTLEFSDNLLNYSIIDLNTDVEFNDTSIIMKDIKNSKISSVLRLSYDSNSSIWNYYIIYDSTQESSGEAYLRISTALSKWEDNLTSERINDAGLNEEAILNPLQPEESIQGDIATAAEQAGFVFSFIITQNSINMSLTHLHHLVYNKHTYGLCHATTTKVNSIKNIF